MSIVGAWKQNEAAITPGQFLRLPVQIICIQYHATMYLMKFPKWNKIYVLNNHIPYIHEQAGIKRILQFIN